MQLSDEDMVRRINRNLMPELRQCALLLEFAEPVKLPQLQDLTLVRLYREQQQNGEPDRFMLRVTDPAYHKRLSCHACGGGVRLAGSDAVYTCRNARCAMSGVRIAKLRHQGITAVRWHRSFVHHWEAVTVGGNVTVDFERLMDDDRPVEAKQQADAIVEAMQQQQVRQVPWLTRAIATLDRRYDDTVLAAAYRTVGALADQKGWKLATPAA